MKKVNVDGDIRVCSFGSGAYIDALSFGGKLVKKDLIRKVLRLRFFG